jgi:transcriptional regulator with XRE-family HTH domain
MSDDIIKKFIAFETFLPMSNRVRGELLREWRLANNLETGVLARKAILSQGQILQLESGETSLFYSQAVQEKAARKVAVLLGGDPDLVIRADEKSKADALNQPTVVDALIELRKRQGHSVASAWRLSPSLWGTLALLILGGVGVMGIAAQFNEGIPRLSIGFFENSKAPVVKNSDASLVPEPLVQPQTTLQPQAPNPPATLLPQPQVTDSKPEVMRNVPKVQIAVTIENPVVLPELTLLTTEQSDEAQSNSR